MSKRADSEGTTRKRADGRWECIITTGYENGKRTRKSVYGATQKEALEKAADVKRRVGQSLPIPAERLTVKAYLETWLADSVTGSVRPSTLASYRSYVNRHLIPGLGHHRLQKLQPGQVQAFLNSKQAAGLAPRTVQYMRAILRKALNQALRWGLVGRNVATLVDPPKSKRVEQSFLTPLQARAFLLGIRGDRLEALLVTSLALGLRPGEARGLRWSDVDLDARELRIMQTVLRVEGKLTFSEPKTDRSRRTLSIPKLVHDLLVAHKPAQDIIRAQAGVRWQDYDLVFPTSLGTPMDAANALQGLHRILERLRLPRVRAQDLRHSCASLLLVQGVHPRVVMDQLGHSQISLTMNTYSHVMPALLKEAADEMQKVLSA